MACACRCLDEGVTALTPRTSQLLPLVVHGFRIALEPTWLYQILKLVLQMRSSTSSLSFQLVAGTAAAILSSTSSAELFFWQACVLPAGPHPAVLPVFGTRRCPPVRLHRPEGRKLVRPCPGHQLRAARHRVALGQFNLPLRENVLAVIDHLEGQG